MEKQLEVAIVGCGAICGNHINAILAAGHRICALCDTVLKRAREKAEKYGLENVRLYADYQALLERERPDAIHICTPHHLHAPMTVEALKRGIHVLCEKPLCISMKQLRELREAAEKSEAQLGVCHQNRYLPNMIRLKELSREGVRGGFGSVVWHRDEQYYRSGQWRGTWAQEGGGVMINQALHTLDLMQWICGLPQRVIAHTHTDLLGDVIEVEDTATACFECENGSRFNFFATNTAAADLPIHLQIKLNNGDVIDVQNRQFSVNHQPMESVQGGEIVGKQVWGDGHKALIRDFYTCIREQRPFAIGVEEGGRVIRMILAMYASHGNPIVIPNESEEP